MTLILLLEIPKKVIFINRYEGLKVMKKEKYVLLYDNGPDMNDKISESFTIVKKTK